MDLSGIAVSNPDVVWIAIAFSLGSLARLLNLPPLVGFLVAGFALHAIGITQSEILSEIADLGVTLLLFSIGLKLELRSLLRPEIWAVASIHSLIAVIGYGGMLYVLSLAGLALFAGLDFAPLLIVAFALSFSSTVFAVKVLEEKGELASLHGRVTIGILIVQDLFAVVFLTVSTGKIPSPWALLLLVLIPFRHVLMRLMDKLGHGELLILYGLLLALGGAALFETVGMKADLGALSLGVLVAQHPRASEMARSLLGFKDIFLVGFFLNIGLSGDPAVQTFVIAVLLVLLLVFKIGLFYGLLARFKLRALTSFLTSLSLANYSEFGLIVCAIAVENGWLSGDWLIIMAIALSLSFIVASPLNAIAHILYTRYDKALKRFERAERLADDQLIDTRDAEILVFGMGRVGSGAYDAMREHYQEKVLGVDSDAEMVKTHENLNRNVILGDATDDDFWEKLLPHNIRLVMLALPSHQENMLVAEQLTRCSFSGRIAATAKYDDHVEQLKAAGVHAAFNIYAEAGVGFAEHVCAEINPSLSKSPLGS